MTITLVLIGITAFASAIAFVLFVAYHCQDDDLAQLECHENFEAVACKHLNQLDVVVDYTCTLEKVETHCLDCGNIIDTWIDV